MKTTELQITESTKQAINEFLTLSEKFKNAYFWNPPSNASGRRSMEEKNSFSYSGDGIELEFTISCSARNVYVNKSIFIDGKRTNATALKKFTK